jgi:hypothetical protein
VILKLTQWLQGFLQISKDDEIRVGRDGKGIEENPEAIVLTLESPWKQLVPSTEETPYKYSVVGLAFQVRTNG